MVHLLKQRYRIVSQIGQGGMGAVYKAEDTQLGNRLVAVKEMSQYGLSPQEIIEAADGFKREAHLLAGLHDPNLPSIHDHFEEAGHWYFVMSFIEGETLEDYLITKGGWLPIEEVLDIGIQLCTVLDYLHTRQPPIIFRDLKPSNVMRTPKGHLYLIDFGIARHFKPGQTKDTSAFGSMGYAPPELFRKIQTTNQSDIYSLGAMLHQLLTGNDPTTNTPTLFDFPPLQLHGQAAPVDLETFIMQMVEKVVSKRLTSMATAKQELQRIAAQSRLPIGKTPLPSTQPVPITPKRPINPAQLIIPWRPTQVPQVTPKPLIAPQPSKRRFSRRTVIVGLAGLAVAGYSLNWLIQKQKTSSPSFDSNDVPTPTNTFVSLGTTFFTYHGHSASVQALTWSPDGQRIASGSDDQTVQVWDSTDGNNILTYHTGSVSTVSWSPNGIHIASGSGNTVQVWDATDGSSVFIYRGHSDPVDTVAWSPDGKHIASGAEDNTVQVWNADTGDNVFIYRGHSNPVIGVAWSPDGKHIASASTDKTVQVWDATDGSSVFIYRGHSDSVGTVAWSLDGKHIASGSDDKTVQVWDVISGHSIFIYRGHSDWIWDVAWSPDGTHIASASEDTTVQVWQVP